MNPSDDPIPAPWTPEQVAQLNAYQHSGWHPYTCGTPNCWEWTTILDRSFATSTTLVAQVDGWHCPKCAYRQTWAAPVMFEIGIQTLAGINTLEFPIL